MTLKSQIGNELNSLPPDQLAKAYQYISSLKKKRVKEVRFAWKKYIGILSDREAKALKKVMNREFETIEGEW